MSRNGSGTYTAPASSWNPAVNGALASYTDWNSLLADIVAALTQSLSSDGQTPLTGNLNFNGNKITGLGAGSGTGQSLRWEQLFSQGTELDIASAATVDIGAQNTNFLRVTGTTTITSFGTNYNGPRFLRFAGSVLLTNSATLILPGGANITTAAGDCLIAIPKATSGTSDGWQVVAISNLNRAIFVDASGNVGIGTSSPSAPLTIKASSASAYAIDLIGRSDNISILNFKTADNATVLGSIGQYGTTLNINNTGNGPIAVYTNNTERMRIDSSGNVGIGTSSPSGKLDVNGTIATTYSTTVKGGFTAGSGAVFLSAITNHPLIFETNGTERARIDSIGNFLFNSGYGSVQTAYGCRAWVNFNGSTGAIRGSGGVTSVTRNGVGDYTVNFSFTMPDTNYSVNGSISDSASGTSTIRVRSSSSGGAPDLMSTTAVRIAAVIDSNVVNVQILR